MKKYFFFYLLSFGYFLLGIPEWAVAQKHCDLEVRIISPADGEIIEYGDTVKLVFSITNMGPDVLDTNDHIYVAMEGDPINSVYYVDLSVGDSVQYLFASMVNGQTEDYSFNACIFLRNELHTGIVDSVQTNDTSCVTFTLEGSSTGIVGSEDAKSDKALTLFPNPATTQVTVPLPPDLQTPATITVIDAVGRVCLQVNYAKQQLRGNSSLQVDISLLDPGIYYLQRTAGGHTSIGKLVVY